MNYLLVALGGALGSVLRYCAGSFFLFPFGTLAVNIAGSFAMGLAYGLLSDKGLEKASLLLMAGFLGGFTTFSAFSLDVVKLLSDAKLFHGFLYIFTSVLGAIFSVWMGFLLAKGMSS
jgi:CrcB protein